MSYPFGIYEEIKRDRGEYVLGDKDLEAKKDEGIWPVRITKPSRYERLMENYLEGNLNFERDISLLDVGSSTGIATENLVEKIEEREDYSVNSVALDLDKYVLEECYREDHAEPVMGKAQQLPFKEGSFDVVISNTLVLREEPIKHIADEIDRVMSEDGVAVLGSGYGNHSGFYEGGV